MHACIHTYTVGLHMLTKDQGVEEGSKGGKPNKPKSCRRFVETPQACKQPQVNPDSSSDTCRSFCSPHLPLSVNIGCLCRCYQISLGWNCSWCSHIPKQSVVVERLEFKLVFSICDFQRIGLFSWMFSMWTASSLIQHMKRLISKCCPLSLTLSVNMIATFEGAQQVLKTLWWKAPNWILWITSNYYPFMRNILGSAP